MVWHDKDSEFILNRKTFSGTISRAYFKDLALNFESQKPIKPFWTPLKCIFSFKRENVINEI